MTRSLKVLALTLLLAPTLQSQGYPEDIAIVPHVGMSLRSSNLERRLNGLPGLYGSRYYFGTGPSYGVGLEFHRLAHTVTWRLDYAQTSSRSFRQRTPDYGAIRGTPKASTQIGSVNAIVTPARACARGVCARLLGGVGVQHTNVRVETLSDDIIERLVDSQYNPALILGIGARIRLRRGALLIDLRDEMSRFHLGGYAPSVTQILHTPNLSFGLAIPLRGGV